METVKYEKIVHSNQIPAMITILRKEEIHHFFQNDLFIPAHWHRSIEVSLIDHASVVLQVGKEKTVIENDFTCINSGVVHSLWGNSYDEEVHCIIVILSYDFVRKVYPNIDDVVFDLSIKKDHQDLRLLYQKLEKLYLHQNETTYLSIAACLLEILQCLLDNYMIPKDKTMRNSAKNQEKIKKVLSYLHDHYQEDLTLKSMAQHYSMSPEHFSRKFHNYTGRTFRDYLTNYRLMKAYDDIVNSDSTIQDISQKHGFLNVKSLIKAFSENYGETPLKYRKKRQKKA